MGDFLMLISLFPHLYKQAKVMVYEYNKILYFGSGNQSGRMKFTTHHDSNDGVSNQLSD